MRSPAGNYSNIFLKGVKIIIKSGLNTISFKYIVLLLTAVSAFLAAFLAVPSKAVAAECEKIEFSELSPTDAKSFTITASGVKTDGQVKDIWFKISFEDKTVRLYKPKKVQNGTYTLDFNISDFDNSYGIYYITVCAQYPTDKGGMKELKRRGIEVVGKVTDTFIMGKSRTTPEQMVKYFENSGYKYPEFYEQTPRSVSLEDFAQMYYEICETEGVRAEAAWVQMCLETGYLNFSNLVKKEQFNFAGLGATGPGEPGFDFADFYGDDYDGIRAGIIGHVQHLKCYASDEEVNIFFEGQAYDPRWNEKLRGMSETLERLEGKWAVSAGYGMDLARGVERLLNTQIL